MPVEELTPEEVQRLIPRGSVEELTREQAEQAIAPPIPEPIQNIVERPVPTGEMALRDLGVGARPAMVAGGAMAGAEMGMMAGRGSGPVGQLLMMLAGGAGGALAGSVSFDSANDLVELLGMESLPGATPRGDTELETAANRLRRGAGESVQDVAFAGGAAAATKVIGGAARVGLGKIMGVRSDQAREMTDLARRQGVSLGAVDVGNFVPRAFARVAGVFPFTGTPALQQMTTKRQQVRSAANRILDELAPTATLADEVSIDMFKAAQGASENFSNISALMYNTARSGLRSIKDANGNLLPIIPTDITRGTITRFLEEARLGEVPTKAGEPLRRKVGEEVREFLQDAQLVADELTYDQWRGLELEIEGLLDKATPNDMRILVNVKKALEQDLGRIGEVGEDILRRVAPDALTVEANIPRLREAVQRKRDADEFFAKGILPFQTTTAKKFAKGDPKIFKAGPGRSGAINVDELTRSVFNADSATALRELRSLVGDDVFNRTARSHLQDVVQRSIKVEKRTSGDVEVFDLDAFASNLGLTKQLTNRRSALEEMLRDTPTSVKDIEDLIESARVQKINDPGQFVMRRVTLGGVAAIGAVVGFGGGALGQVGVTGAVALTLMTRHFSRIISDPKKLEMLQKSFAPELDDFVRRQNVFRLARALGETFDPISTPGKIQLELDEFLERERE